MITVHLPADLAADLGSPKAVSLPLPPDPDLAAVVARLDGMYPGLRRSVTEADGSLRPHLAVYVGTRDARRSGGMAAAVADLADVWILKAVSGG